MIPRRYVIAGSAEEFEGEGCGPEFYIGQTSVVEDRPGHLLFAYEGPRTDNGPQRV